MVTWIWKIFSNWNLNTCAKFFQEVCPIKQHLPMLIVALEQESGATVWYGGFKSSTRSVREFVELQRIF